MFGSPVTSGFERKRSSASASGITRISGFRIAWAQKETSRGVSETSRPRRDLNHCRSASTKVTSAIGVPHKRGEPSQIVEFLLGNGVQDGVPVKSFESRSFVLG